MGTTSHTMRSTRGNCTKKTKTTTTKKKEKNKLLTIIEVFQYS